MMKRSRRLTPISPTSAAAPGLLMQGRRAGQAEPAAGQPGSPALKGHRWFAAIYDLISSCWERRLLSQVRPWIAGQATGRVLEIGAGTGANFPHYRAAEQIVAVEPDPYMLRRARKRAAKLGLDVEFHRCPAEALPFADASFDTVVATLVFCTVADPARSLGEARRVLKGRGTLRFIEHVRASDGSLARLQNALTPLWRRLGAGCHLNRRTAEAIAAAGFDIVKLEQRPSPPLPLVVGVARPKEQTGGEGHDER